MRGKAAGASAEAIHDLEAAAADAGSDSWVRGESLYYLCVAAEKAGDTQKAIDAADKMLATENGKGGWPYLMCAFAKIRILINEMKLEAAGQIIKELNESRTWGQDEYYLRYLEASGDLALARGDTDKAGKLYTQAAGINTHKSYVKQVQDKLDKLQNTNATTAVK
jgi:predicted negative regulator of RcsB-dependent stress response